MRKVIAMIHLSLDGCSSGPNDELDWISYDPELEQYAHSMHAITDAVIWGRVTYQGMAGYWLTGPGKPASTPAEPQHSKLLKKLAQIAASPNRDLIERANSTNTS